MKWWRELREQVWERRVESYMDTARKADEAGIIPPGIQPYWRDPLLEAMRRVQQGGTNGTDR